MRRLLAPMLLGLAWLCGCTSEIASEAGDQCQKILDEQIPAVVDEIEQRCQKQINDATDDLVSQIEALIEQTLNDAEVEVFTRLGCAQIDAGPGWDCSGSEICGNP